MTQDRHRPERFLPLPPAWLDILLALCADDLHGYAVMQEVARTADAPLHPGTLYRALARLLESELIVELDTRPQRGRRRASPLLPRDRPRARGRACRSDAPRTGRGPRARREALCLTRPMPTSTPWPIAVALRSYPRQFRARFGADLCARARPRTGAPPGAATSSRGCATAAVCCRPRSPRDAPSAAPPSRARPGAPIVRTSTPPHGRRATMWDSLMHDVRAAVRGLASARAFTALTVVALGLGLGANSAVFAVVNGVLLRPLPYEHPERLAMLWSENPRLANETNPLSPANFDDLRRMSRSFESLDYALSFIVRVGIQGQEDQGVVQVLRVGSTLLPHRRRAHAARAAHGARRTRRRRGQRPRVAHEVRRRPDGRRSHASCCRATSPLTIVGVAAPEFVFPLRDMLWQAGTTTPHVADLWVPDADGGAALGRNQTAPWCDPHTPSWRSAVCARASRRLRPAPSCARTLRHWPTAIPTPIVAGARASSTCTRRPPARCGWGCRRCRPARCCCCSWPR